MRRSTHITAVLAALFLLTACAAGTAPAPSSPATFSSTGTAIVKGGPAEKVYLFARGQVTITKIDKTALVDGGDNPLYRTIEVTAGAHAVYFNYRHSALCTNGSACAMSLSRDRKIALDATAGHVYRVRATYRDGQLRFWITDESDDRRVVAGNLPDGFDWAANVQGLGGDRAF